MPVQNKKVISKDKVSEPSNKKEKEYITGEELIKAVSEKIRAFAIKKRN